MRNPEKIVSKVAQRLSTGKLLANIVRSTPKTSIADLRKMHLIDDASGKVL